MPCRKHRKPPTTAPNPRRNKITTATLGSPPSLWERRRLGGISRRPADVLLFPADVLLFPDKPLADKPLVGISSTYSIRVTFFVERLRTNTLDFSSDMISRL